MNCQRCNGSGLGNFCHFDARAVRAHAADNAQAVENALCAELASLPADTDRANRLSGMAEHHPKELVTRIRRGTWRAMGGAA